MTTQQRVARDFAAVRAPKSEPDWRRFVPLADAIANPGERPVSTVLTSSRRA